MMTPMVSDGLQVKTLRVITFASGCVSALAPCSASTRTISRSDRMPTIRRSGPSTSSAPILCSASVRTAVSSVAVGSIDTTWPPLAERIFLTCMGRLPRPAWLRPAECRVENARLPSSYVASAAPSGHGRTHAAMPCEHPAGRSSRHRPRSAALTCARLSVGTPYAARSMRVGQACSADGRGRPWPFAVVDCGRDRIEYGKPQKTGQEAADMRLPCDCLLDAEHPHREHFPEQNIDAEPDQQECDHARIAKTYQERRCRHPAGLGAVAPHLERPA